MQESGKFPIYINNNFYLLQFEETKESRKFKTKLIESYGNHISDIYDAKDDNEDEIRQKIYHKIAEEYESRAGMYHDLRDWNSHIRFVALAQNTVYIHNIIPAWHDVEGKHYVHFTINPYIVYHIDKNFMSDYVDLKNLSLERDSSLFKTKDKELNEEERLEMMDTYFSLLKIKDITPYFVPRIHCTFDIEESREQNVVAALQGKEKFDINYKTIYEENISSPLIQQQLLAYFLQENPQYGRVTDQGVELLYFTKEDEVHAINNEKYLHEFPKFKEKLFKEFGEKEKGKSYIKK